MLSIFKPEKKSFDQTAFTILNYLQGGFLFAKDGQKYIDYYLQASPVNTGLQLIADNITSIDFAIYDKKRDEFIYDHPLLVLLNRPNPFTSGDLFLQEIVYFYKLTGNYYLNIVGNSKPVELNTLKPSNLTIEANTKDGYAEIYKFQTGNSSIEYKRDDKKRFIASNKNEITHLRTFNPNYSSNNLTGVSSLTACELEISQYLLANIHNNSLLKNGARPSGILSFKGDTNSLTQEVIDNVKKVVKEKLQGSNNAGEVPFLGGDFTWQQLSESVKDMDFATLNKRNAETIYNALKIPLPMVSPDNMTLANMESAKLNFYDNNILPLFKTICCFLGDSLLPRYANSENLVLTFDDATIEALEPRRMSNLEKRVKFNIETINELRALLGQEALATGGDTVNQPINMIAVGTDANTASGRDAPAVDKAAYINLMQSLKKLDGTRLYSDELINKNLGYFYVK